MPFKNIMLLAFVFSVGLIRSMEPTDFSEQDEINIIDCSLIVQKELWDKEKENENEKLKGIFFSRYGFRSIINEASGLLLKDDIRNISDAVKYNWEPRRKGFDLLNLLDLVEREQDKNKVNEYKKIAIELIRSGADLSVIFEKKPFQERQPLHMALSKKGNLALDLDDDQEGVLCAKKVDTLQEIIEELVNACADLNEKDKDGYTPLLLAVLLYDIKSIKLILPHMEDLNAANNKGITALILATKFGITEIVKLLILYGADPMLVDQNGKTAFNHACEKGHTEIADILADYEQQWVELTEQPARKKQRISKEEE